MSTVPLPLRVEYVGLVASPALRAQVAAEAAQLARFGEHLDLVTLSVGRWYLHHDAGHLYRVTLDVALGEGAHPLAVALESPVGAEPTVLGGLLATAFGTAARQLAAALARAT